VVARRSSTRSVLASYRLPGTRRHARLHHGAGGDRRGWRSFRAPEMERLFIAVPGRCPQHWRSAGGLRITAPLWCLRAVQFSRVEHRAKSEGSVSGAVHAVQHINRHGPTTAGGGFAACVGGPVIFTLDAARMHPCRLVFCVAFAALAQAALAISPVPAPPLPKLCVHFVQGTATLTQDSAAALQSFLPHAIAEIVVRYDSSILERNLRIAGDIETAAVLFAVKRQKALIAHIEKLKPGVHWKAGISRFQETETDRTCQAFVQ
jgi:hypothetical protein